MKRRSWVGVLLGGVLAGWLQLASLGHPQQPPPAAGVQSPAAAPAPAPSPAPAPHDHAGPPPSGSDPAERLRRFDLNHDGLLDPAEVPPEVRLFIEARLGVRLDRPMAIDELGRIIRERRGAAERRDARPPASSANHATTPLVPGFGSAERAIPPSFGIGRDDPAGNQKPLDQRYDKKVVEYVDGLLKKYDKNGNGMLDQEEWPGIPWRGSPKESDLNRDGRLSRAELCERFAKRFATENKAGAPQTSGSQKQPAAGATPQSGAAGADAARIRTYAESLLRQYDDNKNGRLERDEWTRMRGNWAEADRNSDGLLTLDEIVQHLSKYGRGSSSGGRTAGSGAHRSYRFLSPTERLPSGLPAWFSRSDLDGDGQVTLAEFAPTGDSAKVAEFGKYDQNGDGVVTPRECLAAEKAAAAKR